MSHSLIESSDQSDWVLGFGVRLWLAECRSRALPLQALLTSSLPAMLLWRTPPSLSTRLCQPHPSPRPRGCHRLARRQVGKAVGARLCMPGGGCTGCVLGSLLSWLRWVAGSALGQGAAAQAPQKAGNSVLMEILKASVQAQPQGGHIAPGAASAVLLRLHSRLSTRRLQLISTGDACRQHAPVASRHPDDSTRAASWCPFGAAAGRS